MMEFLAYFFATLYSIDILLLFLFGVHTYIMVRLYRKNRDRCKSDSPYARKAIDLDAVSAGDLPHVTIQLPIFNEYYVVDRLVDSAVRIQWPKERLEIQILDDSTDETKEKAAQLAEQYRNEGYNIRHIHRTNRAGHKAGALREGLEKAQGEYIGIFDADFVPAPDFLLKSIPYFEDSDIGMVQTRWGHINADYSPLTRAQSMGIDGHFMIEQVARNASKLWMNFNGTGGIWRRRCIYEAGNWQSDTLTEDFDLSYRAELAGWKFHYILDVVNPAELPATVSAYRSQQFRWCKGSIQTAVKLIPRIVRSNFNWKIKSEALVHLLNYSVHPLMVLNILLTLPLLMLDFWTHFSLRDAPIVALFASAFVLSAGTFGPIFFYIYSQRELYPDWRRRSKWVPVLMVIGTGIAVSNTRAFLEALMGIQSTFKRTPKLRIESKMDRIADRNLYRTPLDPTVYFEFFMGLYSLAIIVVSIIQGRYFILPFMIIYALGFFYISIGAIMENRVHKPEVQQIPAPSPAIGSV